MPKQTKKPKTAPATSPAPAAAQATDLDTPWYTPAEEAAEEQNWSEVPEGAEAAQSSLQLMDDKFDTNNVSALGSVLNALVPRDGYGVEAKIRVAYAPVPNIKFGLDFQTKAERNDGKCEMRVYLGAFARASLEAPWFGEVFAEARLGGAIDAKGDTWEECFDFIRGLIYEKVKGCGAPKADVVAELMCGADGNAALRAMDDGDSATTSIEGSLDFGYENEEPGSQRSGGFGATAVVGTQWTRDAKSKKLVAKEVAVAKMSGAVNGYGVEIEGKSGKGVPTTGKIVFKGKADVRNQSLLLNWLASGTKTVQDIMYSRSEAIFSTMASSANVVWGNLPDVMATEALATVAGEGKTLDKFGSDYEVSLELAYDGARWSAKLDCASVTEMGFKAGAGVSAELTVARKTPIFSVSHTF